VRPAYYFRTPVARQLARAASLALGSPASLGDVLRDGYTPTQSQRHPTTNIQFPDLNMAGQGVERGMSKWGAWWADCWLMLWWLAISVIGGELLALILREVSF
jgi:hypothetical protein